MSRTWSAHARLQPPGLVPILRSPPFPGAGRAVAAVSVIGRDTGAVLPDDHVVALLRYMARARVGGVFWGAQPEVPPGVVRWVHLERERDALAFDCADLDPATLLSLPHRRWAQGLAQRFAATGATVVRGAIDPWYMFDRIGQIVADPACEMAFLAEVAGIATASPGRNTPRIADEPGKGLLPRARARLVEGVRYRDPFTDAPSSVEEAIDRLAAWRRNIDRNRGIGAASGIAVWKQRALVPMLWDGQERLFVSRSARRAARHAAVRKGALLIWPARAPGDAAGQASRFGVALATVEDGFVRSNGLGSDCVPPGSIVVDGAAPHYDPRIVTDLEAIIQTAVFPAPLLARADRVTQDIVARGIGKYAATAPVARHIPGQRRRILITGQVEDDASVAFPGSGFPGNLGLLRNAREREPGAHIVFRPHPDVEAGHRRGHLDDGAALRYADVVDRLTPLVALMEDCDAVHVFSSLSGFEALLRGRQVIVHGSPFYAGWGLTVDLHPLLRRTRRVSLRQLVAAALILYPRYWDAITRLPCEIETVIRRFDQPPAPPSLLTRFRRMRRFLPRKRSLLMRASRTQTA